MVNIQRDPFAVKRAMTGPPNAGKEQRPSAFQRARRNSSEQEALPNQTTSRVELVGREYLSIKSATINASDSSFSSFTSRSKRVIEFSQGLFQHWQECSSHGHMSKGSAYRGLVVSLQAIAQEFGVHRGSAREEAGRHPDICRPRPGIIQQHLQRTFKGNCPAKRRGPAIGTRAYRNFVESG